MKNVFAFSIGLCLSNIILAQQPEDALRFSQIQPGGTARVQGIGGATIGLGGDLTNIFTNPAGIGMYKTGEFVITPGFSFVNNKGSYLQGSASDNKSQFNFGTTGFLISSPSNRGNWKNFTWGLAINRTADFNGNTVISGLNNLSSFSDQYLDQLIRDGVTDPNDAASNYPNGTSLAFNTFVIDTASDALGNFGYKRLSTVETGVNQEQRIETKGGITDFAIGGAGNLGDRLFLGGSVGFTVLNFRRNSVFTESDATTDPANDFDYFTVTEYLKTNGAGINLKLGIIYRPIELLRIGFNFQSPTWYTMKDEYSTEISSSLEGYNGIEGVQTQSSRDFNDGFLSEYNYNFRNPLRLGLGFSWVFREEADTRKQRGFVTAEVEYLSYKAGRFSEQDDGDIAGQEYFESVNEAIDNVFRSAVNARLGGELKFNTFLVRGGFAYYGNPYAQDFYGVASGPRDKGSRTNITGGLGWRDKGLFVDLAYVHQISKTPYISYRLDEGPFSTATIKGSRGTALLTFGVKF